MSLAEKLFGSFSDRELKKINPITKKVLALETKYQPMSDAELQAQTPALKERLANGETLDDILPDAFAVCREAAWRVLGMKHFPVQIMGGIALHRGSIAEMQTGEGKTLVATLPAYLNALTGEGVHIVTVNDYLAKRDSEWMGKLYRWLGLNVGLIVQGIVVELPAFPLEGIGFGPEILAGKGDLGPMGQVAAMGERHAQNGVAGVEKGQKYGEIGRRTGIGLHIDVLGAEQGLGPLDGQGFDLIDQLLALVVAFAHIAFRILVGEHRAGGLHHRRADIVFRRDEAYFLVLPQLFLKNAAVYLRILLP